MVFHAVDGAALMVRYWSKKSGYNVSASDSAVSVKDRRRKRARTDFMKNAIASAGISTVLSGLAVIATEPLNVSRAFMSRIEASFMLESTFRRLR